MKTLIFIFFLYCSNALLYGQVLSGSVVEMNSNIPVEYVNIGIVGKTIGTISDENGRYTFQISPEYHNDTLRFSCIGFHSYSVKISDFINMHNWIVNLEKREYELAEVVIRPRKVKEKTLGITANSLSSSWRTPFYPYEKTFLGWEMGMFMKSKKTSHIKEVNWNIAEFTYDTIVFRVHIYKVLEETKIEHSNKAVYTPRTKYENILENSVLITCTKDAIKNIITVDLRHLNLVVEGDFLVTFEYVKISGNGEFRYHTKNSPVFITRHFIGSSRWTGFPNWRVEWGPGPSIWVLVDVES